MNEPFDPSAYGPVFAAWIAACDEPPLDEGRATGTGASLSSADAFAHARLRDRESGNCCLAAAWLLEGSLEQAHRLCQDVPTPSGSYLHGVVHRRDGDYGNAKYWFRNAGDHPAAAAIAAAASQRPATEHLGDGGEWNAIGFVDLCAQAVRDGDESLVADCRALQLAEWRAVFDWCYRSAIE